MVKNMAKSITSESTENGGNKIQSRQAFYSKIAARGDELIQRLFDLSESKNQAISLGATRDLISRILPELKGVEIKGENGEPIKLQLIAGNGYLPQLIALNAASEESTTREQQEIQSTDLAPQSTEDNNSGN